MHCMIMNYVPTAQVDGTLDAHGDMDAWIAYTRAMVDAGVMRSGNALKPGTTATTVRLRGGRPDIHDGPYIESKEELGGYYIIEVADLEEALRWAARNPAASYGAVEVRPVIGA